MVQIVIIANIINFFAGISSILSTQGKNKNQIVFMEFIGSVLRIIGNILVKSWSDTIAKIIKSIAQYMSLKNKLNKSLFLIISLLYITICISITYILKDIRYLIAIIPSIIEFYSLLVSSTKDYRWYIVITKIFWTINNILFQLYVGILFDIIIVVGHLLKIKKSKNTNIDLN